MAQPTPATEPTKPETVDRTVLRARGQVTLPAQIRLQLGLHEATIS